MSGDPQSVDAVVLGAGAAGLMGAIAAGRRGRRVAVLDHARKLGTKILISGGGRCNFTNLEIAPERFLSRNPQFARSALGRFTQWDFIGLVEAHGIAWHEKTLGQLFCDGSAREILDLLLAECRDAGVRVVPGAPVREVARAPEAGGGFTVRSEAGTWSAPRLVLATGGPSIPKTGATGFAYELARQFGLGLVEPRPGLVPLTLDAEQLELARPLSGVAVDSVASYGKAAFREATLFTHRGVSGPAILQVSSYWQAGADARGREGRAGESRDRDATVRLDLLPAADADWLVGRKRDRPKIALATALAGPTADAVVIPEPSDFDCWIANDGVSYFRVTVAGKSAHAANTDSGVNAITKAAPIHSALVDLHETRKETVHDDRFERDGENTVSLNVGCLHAGEWPSSVPDEAVLEGRVSHAPAETRATIREQVEAAVAEAVADDRWFDEHPPAVEWFGWRGRSAEIDGDEPILETVQSVGEDIMGERPHAIGFPGGIDTRFFVHDADTPALCFGPGAHNIHGADEYLPVDELEDTIAALALIAVAWCGIDDSASDLANATGEGDA